MSQHSFIIPNETGLLFRQDVNSALQALAGLSSGSTAPLTTYAYQLWCDTSGANPLLKVRNAANNGWITIGRLDLANFGIPIYQSGAVAPTTTQSFQSWFDTSSGAIWKIRDVSNTFWITVGDATKVNLGLLNLAGGTLTGALLSTNNDHWQIPAGTTPQRTVSPLVGMLRWNTTTPGFEIYNGATWLTLASLTGTETLTNKSLTAPLLSTFLEFGTSTQPATPASGKRRLYFDGTSVLQLDSSGNVSAIGSGSGGGGINYIQSPSADTGVTGWALYNDAAAIPVNGNGSSPAPTATLTTTSVNPLRGTKSFVYTPGALGNGVNATFPIDIADQGKILQINFDMAIAGTGYTDGALQVWIYDVTNSVLISPSSLNILNTLTNSFFRTTFQTAINSTSYRLMIHQTNAVSTYTLKFDNVALGPQVTSVGTYTGPLTTYAMAITSSGGGTAPTMGSGGGINASYRQSGEFCEITANIGQTGSGTAGTAGTYLFSLPPGVVASSITDTSLQNSVVGGGWSRYGTNNASLSVCMYDSTHLGLRVMSSISDAANAGTVGIVTASFFALNNPGLVYSFNARFPVAGWKSTQVLSSDAGDARAIGAYITLPVGSVVNLVDTVFKTVVYDTLASYSTTTGFYTVLASGYYTVTASVEITGTSSGIFQEGIRIAKNVGGGTFGAIASDLKRTPQTNLAMCYCVSSTLFYAVGDQIKITPVTDRTSATYTATLETPGFSISRQSAFQQIAASERIYLEVSTVSALSLGSASPADIIFNLINANSHSSYNASTGEFTAPRADWYTFSYLLETANANIGTSGNILTFLAKKPFGGAYSTYRGYVIQYGIGVTAQFTPRDSGGLYLNAGDAIKVQAQCASVAVTLSTATTSRFTVSSGGA